MNQIEIPVVMASEDGLGPKVRRPNLPVGSSYTVVEDRGDTMVVETDALPMTNAVVKTTIQDRLRTDLTTVDTITSTALVSVTGSTVAEVRNSAQTALRDLQRQLKDHARISKRLIRAELKAYDSAD